MFDPRDEFQDKVVVITGAAGIFGTWIAEAFAGAGARLALSDVRADKLEQLARRLGISGDRVHLHPTELRDPASIADLVTTTRDALGVADILINNAGIYPSGFLLDIEVDDWDRIMDVNLRAPFVLGRAFAREMVREGKGGNIINVSSGAARSMRSTMVPYCVSKSALDRLSKGMAVEFAEYGIRVNVVEPGFAPGSDFTPLSDQHVKETAAKIPLGRSAGPQDTPGAIMYLCSSAASFITGATLSVDGGSSAGSRAVYQDKKRASV
jgi:3-oxoacyl-[acyl-carrier protein] reductase